jgi:phosphonate transport system ATP-binding protein
LKLDTEAVSARHPVARAGAPDALKRATLSIAAGEHVAVIGPSGAGKTTLLHALACALPPSEGTVRLDGIDPWSLSRSALQKLRGQLYLAPQVPPLPPRQRVVTAVLAGSLPAMSFLQSLRSLFYPRDIAGAHHALEKFDLSDKLFDRVDRLSGGERQRVGLARALVSPARCWLIDEPLSALDPTRAAQAMTTLIASARERSATLVITLHQVEVALARFPRIIGLREGHVAFDLPAQQVTRARLGELYAQHEEELTGAAPTEEAAPLPVAEPVVMHCR